MHSLQATSPLGGVYPYVNIVGGLYISEVLDIALASVSLRRGQEQLARKRARAFLGSSLPSTNEYVKGPRFGAIWVGPGQWFVTAELHSHELLSSEVKNALGDSVSVTEQSDAWCCFAVKGPNCLRLFEKLTSVDVGAISGGQSVRLRLEHLNCILVCLDAAKSFLVFGQRSTAASLLHTLEANANSI